jgi:hypothetical protein
LAYIAPKDELARIEQIIDDWESQVKNGIDLSYNSQVIEFCLPLLKTGNIQIGTDTILFEWVNPCTDIHHVHIPFLSTTHNVVLPIGVTMLFCNGIFDVSSAANLLIASANSGNLLSRAVIKILSSEIQKNDSKYRSRMTIKHLTIKECVDVLEPLATAGNPIYQFFMGWLYASQRKWDLARGYFLGCARYGLPHGQFMLARCYRALSLYKDAQCWYISASNAGMFPAQSELYNYMMYLRKNQIDQTE